jgi:hypothetical protein
VSKRDLDKHFYRNGPCLFHPSYYARHHVVDAIKRGRKAGMSIAELMKEFDLSRAAVKAAIESKPEDSRMTRRETRAAKSHGC